MKKEAGFLLIDVVIVLAISAIVVAGAGMTAAQLFKVTRGSEERAALARHPQSLGYWVSQDMMMAMTANTSDDPGTPDAEFIRIEWKDWETGAIYKVRYVWLNSADQQKKVVRKQTVLDGSGALVSSMSTLVADNILSANISQPNNPRTLSVQALCGNSSAVRQYATTTRPE